MFKVTIDRVELIFITCFTIFFCSHPCSLFLFLSLLFFYLLWFLTISYDSSFTPYLLPYQLCLFFSHFFSGCPTVCSIHSWPIQVHFQVTLFHFTLMYISYNNQISLISSICLLLFIHFTHIHTHCCCYYF